MASHQHISCVLLTEPKPVDAMRIVECHRKLFKTGDVVIDTAPNKDLMELRSNAGLTTYIAAVPAPVPNSEAEIHSRFGLDFVLVARELGSHAAHILVTTRSSSPIDAESLKIHMRNTAAVAMAHEAIAVYNGAAGATHNADFYIEYVASEEFPMAVATGISVASEEGERLSVLTLGLRQFGIQEILASISHARWSEGVKFLFELASHAIKCRHQISNEDTVEYSATVRLGVTYKTSPLNAAEQVVCITLP